MSRSSPSFEDDMRRIREKRNVSREEIHEETKIALENLELFEEGKLDRHPHFNEVYLRAVVRAYAEVLEISKERALQALDRARSGAYRGELGVAYLDREAPADEPPADVEEDEPTEDPAAESESDPGGEEPPVGERADPAARAPDDATSSPEDSAPAAGAGSGETVASALRGKGKFVLGTGILVLVVMLVWALGSMFSGSPPPPAEMEESTTVADTASREDSVAVNRAPVIPEIGDSLEFTVIAATDKLEPIRIRRDDGSWNPYWIEQGDSMSFQAVDEFALRRYLPRARLRVESFDWPIRDMDSYDTLIVTREDVQAHIDSLAADSRN